MQIINPQQIIQNVEQLAWVNDQAAKEIVDVSNLVLYEARESRRASKNVSEYAYIVISGSLQTIKISDQGEQILKILYENNIFGTTFIHGHQLDYEFILASTASTLALKMPVKEVREILAKTSETKDTFNALEKCFNAYHFIKNSTTIGDHVSNEFLIEFVSAFELKQYENNDFIFKQGDPPDGYYICLKGSLEVEVVVNGTIVFSDRIREGDYFGELALISDKNRSASIKALTSSSCYFLSKEIFDSLVQKEPQLLTGFQLLAKLAYG